MRRLQGKLSEALTEESSSIAVSFPIEANDVLKIGSELVLVLEGNRIQRRFGVNPKEPLFPGECTHAVGATVQIVGLIERDSVSLQ